MDRPMKTKGQRQEGDRKPNGLCCRYLDLAWETLCRGEKLRGKRLCKWGRWDVWPFNWNLEGDQNEDSNPFTLLLAAGFILVEYRDKNTGDQLMFGLHHKGVDLNTLKMGKMGEGGQKV